MPQTVPKSPTKGAVDETDARIDMPLCIFAALSSIDARRPLAIHSLRPIAPPSVPS